MTDHSTEEARPADLLAEHEMHGKSVPAAPDHECALITVPHNGCGCSRIMVGCSGCDWITPADGTQGDAFRAHVAEVIEREYVAERIAQAKAEVREEVIDSMTVPPGGPGDDFWRGAQWAYGEVRSRLRPGDDA